MACFLLKLGMPKFVWDLRVTVQPTNVKKENFKKFSSMVIHKKRRRFFQLLGFPNFCG